MVRVELATRECDGQVVVAQRGELDDADDRSGRRVPCHPHRDVIPVTYPAPAGPWDGSYRPRGGHQAARAVARNHRQARAQRGLHAHRPALVARDQLPARLPPGWAGSRSIRPAGPGKSVPPWEGAAARRAGRCRSPPGPAGQQTPRASSRSRAACLAHQPSRTFSRRRPGRRLPLLGALLIILGVILLIIGFVAKVPIIWTIGIIVVVVGAILALLGMAGHAVGGRRHYF